MFEFDLAVLTAYVVRDAQSPDAQPALASLDCVLVDNYCDLALDSKSVDPAQYSAARAGQGAGQGAGAASHSSGSSALPAAPLAVASAAVSSPRSRSAAEAALARPALRSVLLVSEEDDDDEFVSIEHDAPSAAAAATSSLSPVASAEAKADARRVKAAKQQQTLERKKQQRMLDLLAAVTGEKQLSPFGTDWILYCKAKQLHVDVSTVLKRWLAFAESLDSNPSVPAAGMELMRIRLDASHSKWSLCLPESAPRGMLSTNVCLITVLSLLAGSGGHTIDARTTFAALVDFFNFPGGAALAAYLYSHPPRPCEPARSVLCPVLVPFLPFGSG